ncbi:MAG: serine/threonine protein kinase [Phycisphaerales bacterium]|nr:serine/threonine protein kinase [Phycisphaerales bacterium]
MRALGRDDLPEAFTIDGVAYRRTRTVKHDFFAATGFYADPAGRPVVLKVGRAAKFLGWRLDWLGRWLCERELRFYRRFADLPNVPAVVGRVGPTGFVHAYVEGQPLSKDRPVPDGFFDQLDALVTALHARDTAYVDTNKPENILLGDDGRPHLIDFQISFDLHDLDDWPWSRWLLRRMQREDRYHLLKHKKKLRPDEMTKEEWERAERKSALIRAHRFFTRPYFLVRRRAFRKLRETGRLLPEGSK